MHSGLLATLRGLEHEWESADSVRRAALKKDIRAYRAAIEWDQQRSVGPHRYVWRGGRVALPFMAVVGVPLIVFLITEPLPPTETLVRGTLVVGMVFGAMIGVGYLAWQSAERNYQRCLKRADVLEKSVPPNRDREEHSA